MSWRNPPEYLTSYIKIQARQPATTAIPVASQLLRAFQSFLFTTLSIVDSVEKNYALNQNFIVLISPGTRFIDFTILRLFPEIHKHF